MNREELEELTKDALRDHAEAMGVKVLVLDSKGTMIDKILGEYKAPEKIVPKDEAMSPLGALYDLQGHKIDGKRYKLTIFSTESDKSDVDIIVNGHNIRVQRNKEVVVQEAYVNALRDAVIETVIQDPDTGIRTPQKIMVFPHTAIAC